MPRSSRSKSHKQSKHSSKETLTATAREREYSGSDEDVKMRDRTSNGGKEDASVSVRVSKERKHSGKDLSVSHGNTHGNGDLSEDYTNTNTTSSKRREEKSDRWNGGSSDEKGLVLNIENKDVLLKSKDFSKIGSDSKSKSSRRHDVDSVSGGLVLEKDENKSGGSSRGEKRKSEKESARKESSQYKEIKESKEKDRGCDRGRKGHYDKVEADASVKQVENQSSRRGKEITDWPIEEELRNPELEKELEKRMRRRGEGSSDKDKYQDDIKESDDRRLTTRSDRSKDERHKNDEYLDVHREDSIKETRQRDEKYREDGERDRKYRDAKHRGESERYNKHRDDKHREDKYNEDGNKDNKYKDEKYIEIVDKDEKSRDGKRKQDDDRDYRHKEDKHRDVKHRDDPDREKRARDSKYTSRDHLVEPETKRLRDDSVGSDLYHRKTNNRDGSPVYDDRVNTRYKDDKDRRRGNDKESDKRSSAKVDTVSERGRPSSRYADVEIPASHSRRRSSPGSYPARDHHRVSKQEENKYRDYAYEDRPRHNVHSSRDYTSAPAQSDKKVTSKDDGYTRLEVDKSPSSTSNEKRNLSRSDARRSLDLEEPGPRSGGSKDTAKETHPDNDFSQADNDNLSVSSPYTRNSHFSGNSKSLLPPPSPSPFRAGSDSPFFGSTEDDRNKSNNRQRRMVDPNMGRTQGNNWKNIPNWPSPMATGGYLPFQHVPPPMFHPLMQQFPPPMFGRPPMKLNPGLPYHVPDHGRPLTWRNQVDESGPPPLHGWDANNAVFGDESHLYGRPDWDRRTQMSNRGWDQSGGDMWKGQNAGASMDSQSGPQKDGYSGRGQTDEVWSGQTGQPDESEPNQPDIQTETLNLEINTPEAQKVAESPQIVEVVKEDNSALISKAYLSIVDVSEDLTQPELYDQCTSMMDLDKEALSEEFDCKILFLEQGVEANVTDSASLFAAINDSVFQKAMFLYKKQKEEFHSENVEKISCPLTNGPEVVPPFDQEKGSSADEATAMEVVIKENDEPLIQKLDPEANVINDSNKPEEVMDMVADRVVIKQEEEPELTVEEEEKSCAPSAGDDLLPCKVDEAVESVNDEKNVGGDGGGGDGGCLSDVSTATTTEVVAVMPTESIEFGSVNLNRIHHHSPESTH